LKMIDGHQRNSKIGFLAAVLLVLLALCPWSQVEASTAMYSYTSPNFFGNGYYLPQTLGDVFTPSSDITVTNLGVFDYQDNGLGETHAVGIFDKSGALLASTSVSAGTANPLDDHFRYAAIAPLKLTAGQTYTIAALYLTLSDVIGYANIGGISANPDIGLPGFSARYALTGATDLYFPTDTVLASAPFYIGPNFLYTITNSPSIGAQTPSAAPLPPSLLLLGSGLVGLGLLGRRRKRS
jgi:hypothetical protein